MKHLQIAKTSMTAAAAAYYHAAIEDARTTEHSIVEFIEEHAGVGRKLYRYCRDRAFPQPETLWRKFHEFVGRPIDRDFAAIAEAERSFFVAFLGVARALELFHDGLVPPAADDEQPLELSPSARTHIEEQYAETVDPVVDGADAAAGGTGAGAPAAEPAGEAEPAEAVAAPVPETEPVAGAPGGDDPAPGRDAQGSDAGTADAGAPDGADIAHDGKAKKSGKK